MYPGQLLPDQCVSVSTRIPKEQKASEKRAELSQNSAMFSLGQLELPVPMVPAFGISLKLPGGSPTVMQHSRTRTGRGFNMNRNTSVLEEQEGGRGRGCLSSVGLGSDMRRTGEKHIEEHPKCPTAGPGSTRL